MCRLLKGFPVLGFKVAAGHALMTASTEGSSPRLAFAAIVISGARGATTFPVCLGNRKSFSPVDEERVEALRDLAHKTISHKALLVIVPPQKELFEKRSTHDEYEISLATIAHQPVSSEYRF